MAPQLPVESGRRPLPAQQLHYIQTRPARSPQKGSPDPKREQREHAAAVKIQTAWRRYMELRDTLAVQAGNRTRSAVDFNHLPHHEEGHTEIILYGRRWLQLFYLAALAMISDLVCFSVAAQPIGWEETFEQDAANIIDIFLFTNVAACFLEPFVVRRFGLRLPVVAAGILMAVGCLLRSGVPFIGGLPDYKIVVVGTMFVGLAQPFFQCTPPLLSAVWFAQNERALATAVAINFNQVGIATAFLIGGELGGTEEGLKTYFTFITIASFACAIGTTLQFLEKPPTPPSASAMEKEHGAEGEEPSFPTQVRNFFRTKGFIQPLAAFVTSIAVTNVVGAFMGNKLIHSGVTNQRTINISGAAFEMAIVIGGIILGGYVDHTKKYKTTTLACLIFTLVAVLVIGLPGLPQFVVIFALLVIGTFTGPVQPINAELAVDVTFPCDENAIEAIQQLCGNLLSALLVPICERAADLDFDISVGMHVQGDTLVLLGMTGIVTAYYSTFNAPLRRTEIDNAAEGGHHDHHEIEGNGHGNGHAYGNGHATHKNNARSLKDKMYQADDEIKVQKKWQKTGEAGDDSSTPGGCRCGMGLMKSFLPRWLAMWLRHLF